MKRGLGSPGSSTLVITLLLFSMYNCVLPSCTKEASEASLMHLLEFTLVLMGCLVKAQARHLGQKC